jgi:agmatinase
MQFGKSLGQYDFDLDATMFPDIKKGDHRGCVDAGDVPTNAWDSAQNRERITAATRKVLEAGAVPILLGGDDSVPIPMLAAYEGHGPLTILQVDAHVDWADVLQGNPYGYGSTMRRAAEYPWIAHMVQVGIRGLGSGESWQHDDARAWGSQLISSYKLHEVGPAAVTALIEPGAKVFLSIDCDGIDPAVLPKLFNAFEQGEVRALRQQAGLGLGLSISKKLAQAHGGTIVANSEVVAIEVRDRLRSELVVDRRVLVRFVDYRIEA